MKRLILVSVLFILLVQTVSAETKFSLSGSTSYTLGWGKSDSAGITISCINSWYNCNCQKNVNNGGWTTIGQVTAGSQSTTYIPISVPTSGQETKQYSVTIACTDAAEDTYFSKTMTINVNYPSDAEWSAYQAQQESKNKASSDISAAKNEISLAQSSYNDAKNKIQEANNLGANIASAQQYLNLADGDLSSANSLFSNAQNSFNSGSYSTASSYASQAEQKASSAKSNAGIAKSTATQIIEEYNRQKTAAQNKISDANSAIDTAKQGIEKGEGIIYNATILGLDTAEAKSKIATARLKIDSADQYYREASSIFNSATNAESFEGSKSKAQSAIDLAKDAYSLSTTAYESLSYQVTISSEAAKAILNANTEVSQNNEIMAKMDYVLRSIEKYGVNVADTKAVVTTSKTNTDSAEDLLSQAKNRMASGQFSEATNLANKARDSAASSKNRLDTIAQTLSTSSQDALEAAFDRTTEAVKAAQISVDSAGSTYGATVDYVVSAQEYQTKANNALNEAKVHMDKVNAASGLSDLIKELDAAFKALDEANKQAELSLTDSKEAKLGFYKKAAGVGAATAGAAGGGFLYYRIWRKKKKGSKAPDEEVKEKPKGKEKKGKALKKLFKKEEKLDEDKPIKVKESSPKKSKFCGKCGAKVTSIFCPKCGNKVR